MPDHELISKRTAIARKNLSRKELNWKSKEHKYAKSVVNPSRLSHSL